MSDVVDNDYIQEQQPITSTVAVKTKKKKDTELNLSDLVIDMQAYCNNVKVVDKNYSKEVSFIKSPCFVLDLITSGGKGFLPLGKIIEIYGKKSSGKSTLAQLMANMVINNHNGYVLVIDKETDSWVFPKRNLELGLNPDKLGHIMAVQPVTVADVTETILRFLDKMVLKYKITKEPILIVWDSIAGTTSKTEMEAEAGKKKYSDIAKLVTELHRKIEAFVAENNANNVSFLWINQARNNIGDPYATEPVTFGGDSPSFCSAIRFDVQKSKTLAGKKGDQVYPVGIEMRVKTAKNKIFSPFQRAVLNLFFVKGIDDAGTTYKWLEANRLIKKSGKADAEITDKPFKIVTESETLYFDKGLSFKELYNGDKGDILRKHITDEYIKNLEYFTDVMAGNIEIEEKDVEEEPNAVNLPTDDVVL